MSSLLSSVVSTRVTAGHLIRYRRLTASVPAIRKSIHHYLTRGAERSTRWVEHVHLLHPRVYYDQTPVTAEWLYHKSITQLQFRQRLLQDTSLNMVPTADLIEGYHEFLQSLRDNPGVQKVPTLRQDLVWHAHMLDHQLYVEDTTAIFGQILDHHIFPKSSTAKDESKDAGCMAMNPMFATVSDASSSDGGCGGGCSGGCSS